jgi:hypothetical protein
MCHIMKTAVKPIIVSKISATTKKYPPCKYSTIRAGNKAEGTFPFKEYVISTMNIIILNKPAMPEPMQSQVRKGGRLILSVLIMLKKFLLLVLICSV